MPPALLTVSTPSATPDVVISLPLPRDYKYVYAGQKPSSQPLSLLSSRFRRFLVRPCAQWRLTRRWSHRCPSFLQKLRCSSLPPSQEGCIPSPYPCWLTNSECSFNSSDYPLTNTHYTLYAAGPLQSVFKPEYQWMPSAATEPGPRIVFGLTCNRQFLPLPQFQPAWLSAQSRFPHNSTISTTVLCATWFQYLCLPYMCSVSPDWRIFSHVRCRSSFKCSPCALLIRVTGGQCLYFSFISYTFIVLSTNMLLYVVLSD